MSMRRSGRDWFKNEKEVMELLGLKQVPGSGSSWVAREDGENDDVLCQLKSTDAGSIRVQLQDIHELQVHALTSHKLPVFAIQFRQTNEVFLLVSPLELHDAAKYLADPTSFKQLVLEPAMDAAIRETEDWDPPKVVKSSSKSREKFQREREKNYKKKGRSAL